MNNFTILKSAKLILTDLLAGQSCAEFIAQRIDLPLKTTNKMIQLMLQKDYITPVIVQDFTAYRLTAKGQREAKTFSKNTD
jgi:hypothetical protein